MKRTLFATPQDAETAFYEAFEKCDLEAMMAVWADDEDVVCVHPGGPRLTGVEQVRESWRQIFAGGQTLRVRVQQLQVLNGMTLFVHSVYEQLAIAGDPRVRAPVISTNVYLRTQDGWRMVVHHASPAPAATPTVQSEGRRGTNTLH